MENATNLKELLSMLWGDITKTPEEALYEKTVEEGKKHLKPCPLCGKGVIIKGKTAYGCSEWRNGCTFRKAFGAFSET